MVVPEGPAAPPLCTSSPRRNCMQEQGHECSVDYDNDIGGDGVYQKTMVSTMLLWTKQQATLNDVMAVCIGSMRKHRVTDPYHSRMVVYSAWCMVKGMTAGCCLH